MRSPIALKKGFPALGNLQVTPVCQLPLMSRDKFGCASQALGCFRRGGPLALVCLETSCSLSGAQLDW